MSNTFITVFINVSSLFIVSSCQLMSIIYYLPTFFYFPSEYFTQNITLQNFRRLWMSFYVVWRPWRDSVQTAFEWYDLGGEKLFRKWKRILHSEIENLRKKCQEMSWSYVNPKSNMKKKKKKKCCESFVKIKVSWNPPCFNLVVHYF